MYDTEERRREGETARDDVCAQFGSERVITLCEDLAHVSPNLTSIKMDRTFLAFMSLWNSRVENNQHGKSLA